MSSGDPARRLPSCWHRPTTSNAIGPSALVQSKVTRLDGPYLFTYRGRTYAIARFQPDLGKSGPFTAQGSILARKRTSLYEVRETGLGYLTDLPSAGDTLYVGLILDGNIAYATYYTSRIDRD